jgi:hypothetical protein
LSHTAEFLVHVFTVFFDLKSQTVMLTRHKKLLWIISFGILQDFLYLCTVLGSFWMRVRSALAAA